MTSKKKSENQMGAVPPVSRFLYVLVPKAIGRIIVYKINKLSKIMFARDS